MPGYEFERRIFSLPSHTAATRPQRTEHLAAGVTSFRSQQALTKLLPSHKRLIQEKRHKPHQGWRPRGRCPGQRLPGPPRTRSWVPTPARSPEKGQEEQAPPHCRVEGAVAERTCGVSLRWESSVPGVWLPAGLVLSAHKCWVPP